MMRAKLAHGLMGREGKRPVMVMAKGEQGRPMALMLSCRPLKSHTPGKPLQALRCVTSRTAWQKKMGRLIFHTRAERILPQAGVFGEITLKRVKSGHGGAR